MNRSLKDLKGFSLPLPIFEKSLFVDDKNILFSRSENLLFTRNALEILMYGTAE